MKKRRIVGSITMSLMKVLVALVGLLVLAALCSGQKGLPTIPLSNFPCLPYEYRKDDPTPTNVNKLRPHDIKVSREVLLPASTQGKLSFRP